MPKVPSVVRFFGPEGWGQVDRFSAFAQTTYKFSPTQQRALSGVSNHFNKAQVLLALARRLLPNLQIDRDELEKNGFTPARNSRELSCVIEACIAEIYSSVDCTASVVHAVFGPTSRGFKKSTSNLFTSYSKITGSLPDGIKAALGDAHWYRNLRYHRDELTHLDTGSCSLDDETGTVRYMHTGMKVDDKVLIIDDVFEWLKTALNEVNGFIGLVFNHLNATLEDGEVMQMCGIVEGRMLMRVMRPSEPQDFSSGVCMSQHWFDLPENPTCPFKDGCGAYARRAAPELLKRFYGE